MDKNTQNSVSKNSSFIWTWIKTHRIPWNSWNFYLQVHGTGLDSWVLLRWTFPGGIPTWFNKKIPSMDCLDPMIPGLLASLKSGFPPWTGILHRVFGKTKILSSCVLLELPSKTGILRTEKISKIKSKLQPNTPWPLKGVTKFHISVCWTFPGMETPPHPWEVSSKV